MKKKIIDSCINLVNKYYDYDDIKTAELRYGLESLYMTITKMIVAIILSIFIGVTKELLLLSLFYGILRLVMFGAHGKNSIQCWIMSMLIFILVPLLIKYSHVPKLIIIIIFIFQFFLIYKYAPAGTEKRILKNKKKKLVLKYASLFISTCYMFIITYFANDYWSNILFYSLLLSTIFILPITYKIMGVKYRY
ncbi:MAG: accessory gene regulator B family protein [bacterium]|nr:accessory gene regulator B family protein [bacterium]